MSVSEIPMNIEELGDDDSFDEGEDEMDSYITMNVGEKKFLTKDEGVQKELLVEGHGFEQPEKGDEVFVHYTGTLTDGTKFDSSRDREGHFSFKLGVGQVIKGWDVAVATMKKGEKCNLVCTSDYAYGTNGSPPTIPANATLNFEVELFRWKSIKDICGDGGIIKTVTTKGDGYKKPTEVDEVIVTYKATMPDGSIKEEDAVTFAMSTPVICLGVGEILKTMLKDESATCVIKDEYSGEAGGAITLDITLVGIITVEKIESDGSVSKKTLKEGSGWNRPNEGAKVGVRLTGYLPDGTKFEETPEGELTRWVTDEEQQIPGLDKAIMKMKEEEKALITIAAKHAFGDREMKKPLATIPPNTDISYEIELVELEKAKEMYSMKPDEKIEYCESMKAAGNALFKLAKKERALKKYTKALGALDSDNDFSDEQKDKAKAFKAVLHGNSAAVQLKLNQYKEAKQSCNKVLELDGGNVKCLFRRAQASAGLNDNEEAEVDIKKLLETDPNNREARELLKMVKAKVKAQYKKDKAVFGNMFAKGDLYKEEPAIAKKAEDMDSYLGDDAEDDQDGDEAGDGEMAASHGHSHGGAPCDGNHGDHEHKAEE